MKVQRQDDGKRGKFFVEENGKELAEMVYHMNGENQLVINHTAVDESLKGKGVGKELIAESVKFARENNLKIIPVCPFAKAIFEKDKSYEDVLA